MNRLKVVGVLCVATIGGALVGWQTTGTAIGQVKSGMASCAPEDQWENTCLKKAMFTTYPMAARACSGHMMTLPEMISFKSHSTAAKGIECSSTFTESTIWCVGDGGTVSGKSLPAQFASLAQMNVNYRCSPDH